MSVIEPQLNQMETISLQEMDQVALLNRTDTKFILSQNQLPELLKLIQRNYKVLVVEGKRMSRYNTLYFDTFDQKFYHDHHRGKAGRIKVRIRNYVESNLCFLEVKRKNKKGDTVKKRLEVDGFFKEFNANHLAFLEESCKQVLQLSPSLENAFTRITLVNHALTERSTIDLAMSFNKQPAFESAKNSLAIIEVKQDGFSRHSPIVKALKSLNIRPYKVSKYCLGLATVQPALKQNLFKEKFLKINKIIN